MTLLTLGIASATLAGSLGAHSTPLVLLLCVLAAFNYGVLAGVDNTAGWIGQQSAVFVIISSYFSNGVHYALGRTAMVLAGGALQMVLFALSRGLARHPVPAGPPVSPFRIQLRNRMRELWAGLRRQLHWNPGTSGYIVRLSVTLLISTAMYRLFDWRNGYWAPMTALLVLKPKWANTLSRGIARLAGTLVGAGACALLAVHSTFHHWSYFALIVVTAFGCFALQAVNYALFSCVLTLYTVFLFAFGGFSERSAADLRLLNTALGGLIALAVDFTVQQLGPKLKPKLTRQPALAAGS